MRITNIHTTSCAFVHQEKSKMRLRFWKCIQQSKANILAAEPMHFRFYQKKRSESRSKLSMVYCKHNCVQYVQSAVFCKPVVSQSSCSIMPVLTEHRLEIAGLVLRGREKTQLERLPCAPRCDHNIIK